MGLVKAIKVFVLVKADQTYKALHWDDSSTRRVTKLLD